MNPSGNPSASSSQSPPKEDTSDTHLELNAQETDQRKSVSPPPQPPPIPRYYTRSAARRLPPPSPAEIRAGKILINTIDRPPRRRRHTSQNTIWKETTTRVKPPVPPSQRSPSGIVPLGPPPPRQPSRPSSSSSSTNTPPPQSPPPLGRFDHLPPPSLTYHDAYEILKEFLDGVERVKDGLERSELKDLILALQMKLGLPPEADLFEVFQSNDSLQDVIEYVMDYFGTSDGSSPDDSNKTLD